MFTPIKLFDNKIPYKQINCIILLKNNRYDIEQNQLVLEKSTEMKNVIEKNVT